MTRVLFVSILLACLFATAASGADCTSNQFCTTCAVDNSGCILQYKDAYCTCVFRVDHHFVCVASKSCDYTGTPSCPNPTPSGECPSFGPTSNDEAAKTVEDAETDAAPDAQADGSDT